MPQKRRAYLRRVMTIPAAAGGLSNASTAFSSGNRTYVGIGYNPETLELIGVSEATTESENGVPRGSLSIGGETYGFDHGRKGQVEGQAALSFDLEYGESVVGDLTYIGERLHGVLQPAGRIDVPGETTRRIAFTLVDERRGSIDEKLASFERFRRDSQ